MANNILVAFLSAVGIGLLVGAIKLLKLLFKKLAIRAARQEEIEKYGYSRSDQNNS